VLLCTILLLFWCVHKSISGFIRVNFSAWLRANDYIYSYVNLKHSSRDVFKSSSLVLCLTVWPIWILTFHWYIIITSIYALRFIYSTRKLLRSSDFFFTLFLIFLFAYASIIHVLLAHNILFVDVRIWFLRVEYTLNIACKLQNV
jgi:hypothetical protein